MRYIVLAYLRYVVPDMDGVKCRHVIDQRFKNRLREAFYILAECIEDVFQVTLKITTDLFRVIGTVANDTGAVYVLGFADMAVHAGRRHPGYDIAVVDESIGFHLIFIFEVPISDTRGSKGIRARHIADPVGRQGGQGCAQAVTGYPEFQISVQ